MKTLNNDVIAACDQVITEEEKEDNELRTQHGTAFSRPPSGTVNAQYKKSIFEYKEKMTMAVATD